MGHTKIFHEFTKLSWIHKHFVALAGQCQPHSRSCKALWVRRSHSCLFLQGKEALLIHSWVSPWTARVKDFVRSHLRIVKQLFWRNCCASCKGILKLILTISYNTFSATLLWFLCHTCCIKIKYIKNMPCQWLSKRFTKPKSIAVHCQAFASASAPVGALVKVIKPLPLLSLAK